VKGGGGVFVYVGIDLAERHSAAVALDEKFNVLLERAIDSGPALKQEHPWRRFGLYRMWVRDLLGTLLDTTDLVPQITGRYVIEEPYPHAVNVAPSYRMQGAVIAEMQDWGIGEEQVRITKSKPWQDHFGYTKREFGNSKAWAKLMAAGFEYEPGCTLEKTKSKEREDLTDAYLLARWLRETG
jgi:hypothetical protein